jgi:hypothetical protein
MTKIMSSICEINYDPELNRLTREKRGAEECFVRDFLEKDQGWF